MKTPKSNSKPKASTRKAVVQAIAKQEEELKAKTAPAVDINECIRLKAYELFVERGCVHGNDLEHWIEAERIVRQNLR